MMRKYTFSEIEQMRDHVRRLHGIGPSITDITEAMLQTYMMNEIEPDQLRTAADLADKERRARTEEARQKFTRRPGDHRFEAGF
jgi:hypothetical protein